MADREDWVVTNIAVGRGAEGFDVSPDGKELWVANENLHRILIVDAAGRYVGKIKIKNPVGLHLDKKRNMVFVGSKKSSKSTGAVYGV